MISEEEARDIAEVWINEWFNKEDIELGGPRIVNADYEFRLRLSASKEDFVGKIVISSEGKLLSTPSSEQVNKAKKRLQEVKSAQIVIEARLRKAFAVKIAKEDFFSAAKRISLEDLRRCLNDEISSRIRNQEWYCQRTTTLKPIIPDPIKKRTLVFCKKNHCFSEEYSAIYSLMKGIAVWETKPEVSHEIFRKTTKIYSVILGQVFEFYAPAVAGKYPKPDSLDPADIEMLDWMSTKGKPKEIILSIVAEAIELCTLKTFSKYSDRKTW
jgi:hypothetical protein